MNAEFDLPPEGDKPEEEPLNVPKLPEVLTDEEVEKILDGPDKLKTHLQLCMERFTAVKPIDPITMKQYAALVETCAVASRYAESRRTEITVPLNEKLSEANTVWQPIVKGFAALAKTGGAILCKAIDDAAKEAARIQQKLIDDANAERARLAAIKKAEEDKAEALRLEAQRLIDEEAARVAKVEADRIAAEEKALADEQALADAKAKGDADAAKLIEEQLEQDAEAERQRLADAEFERLAAANAIANTTKQADKAEAKAEMAELKESSVVTEIAPAQSRTIDTGTATVGARAPKKKWILAGWDQQGDKYKPLRCIDPLLRDLLGNIDELPKGVQFLLRYSDLNPVYLNKAFGEVPFPKPFDSVDDYKGTAVRGK